MTRCTQGPNPPGDGFVIYCARARFSRGSWRTAGDVIGIIGAVGIIGIGIIGIIVEGFPVSISSSAPVPASASASVSCFLPTYVHAVLYLPLDSRVNTSYRIEMPCMSASPFGMRCDTPNRVESGESAWCLSFLASV